MFKCMVFFFCLKLYKKLLNPFFNTHAFVFSPDKPDASFNSSSELKAKKYFLSCMDENKLIEKAGAQPLLNLVNVLDWGINISAWDEDWDLPKTWNLNLMIEKMHLLNVVSFFSVWVAEDDKDSSTNILQVSKVFYFTLSNVTQHT